MVTVVTQEVVALSDEQKLCWAFPRVKTASLCSQEGQRGSLMGETFTACG